MLSEVPEGWSLQRFGDIASVKNGFAFKSKDFVDSQSGVAAVVRMSDLKNGTVEASSAKKIPLDCLEGLERFKLKAGDFVFGMSGSLNNYAVVPASSFPLYLNQRVGKLEAKGADAAFLRFLYTSEGFMRLVAKSASGNAQLNISGKQIESFEIPVPPFNEQQRIAEILSSVDASIQATQAVIEQAERVKRGLMEELLTGGLGSEAIERGEVPEGWQVNQLGEVCSPKQHPTIAKTKFTSDGYPVYGANGQIGFYSDYTHSERAIAITCRGATCGTINIVPPKSYITGNAMALDSLNESVVTFGFLNHYLRHFGVDACITGSAQPQITRSSLLPLKLVVPPQNEQRRIAEILSASDEFIAAQNSVVEQQSRTKRGLMDDLLTGKVRTV